MLTPTRKVGINARNFPRTWLGVFDVGERLTVVRVVYSDESGTGSIDREPIAVVAALMFNIESQWEPFERDFRKIPRHQSRTELKGSDLFKDLRNGRGPDDPDAVLRAALTIPLRHGIPIFVGANDRPASKAEFESIPAGVRERTDIPADDPYWRAFFACLAALHAYVRTLIPKEKIVWIADDSGALRPRAEQAHAFWRQNIEHLENVPQGEDAERLSEQDWAEIEEQYGSDGPLRYHFPIIDTVYFGNSKASHALQLADICCSVARLKLMKDPIVEPYYPLIKNSIVTGLEART